MEPALLPSSTGSTASALKLDRVGRDGALSLAFERRGGETILVKRCFTLPLQMLEPTAQDDGSVYLMLLNPTGGLVGGDHLRATINLGKGSHVCITTPSATKVYRTIGLPAVQETTIRIEEGAVLEYLPEHLIPYPGSALRQSLTVEMGPKSKAILFDAFAVGRLARGEKWMFRELVNRISVSSCGRPLFLDRIRLEPSTRNFTGLGGMEGFGYFATLVLFADGLEGWSEVACVLENRLSQFLSLSGGACPIPRGGCLVRLLTTSAYDLTEATSVLWCLARKLLLNLPPADMRK
jgi:urease accessory protein